MRRIILNLGLLLVVLQLTACSSENSTESNGNYLARVGRQTLERSQVERMIPSGLTDADSIDFVRNYINNWIDSQLINQAATKVLDMNEIEKKVNKYRQDLIYAEYRSYCFSAIGDTLFSEEELQNYYNRHKELFKVERPMVKGIYLKIPDSSPKLREIRNLLRQGSKSDINRLEGLVAGTAIHYDYFEDQWLEWRKLEQIIPTRFDKAPEAVLHGERMLDLSLGGFTYILKVSAYLPAGSTEPFTEAVPQIKQRILNRRRMNFDASFRNYIRKEAEKYGDVQLK